MKSSAQKILDEITSQVIGAAIEVHKYLGPGLLESIYEECLCYELELRGLSYERQKQLLIDYKGKRLTSVTDLTWLSMVLS